MSTGQALGNPFAQLAQAPHLEALRVMRLAAEIAQIEKSHSIPNTVAPDARKEKP